MMVVASTTICPKAMKFYSSMCSYFSEIFSASPNNEEGLEKMISEYEDGTVHLVVIHDFFFFGMDLNKKSENAVTLKYVKNRDLFSFNY